MDTFDNRGTVVIFCKVFAEVNTAELRALVGFGEQKEPCPVQMLQRLAQCAARQQAAVAKHIVSIYQHYIKVAVQMPVLIAVVHDNYFGLHFIYGKLAGNGTVFTDNNGNARQGFRHQVSFVACLIGRHENLLAVTYHAQLFIPVRAVTTV